MEWQMKLAKRGYGWYLALKIGKAIIAIPWFFVLMVVMICVSAVLLIWNGVKSSRATVMDLLECVADYWRSKWFKGFSRTYYRSLSYYKATTIARRTPEQAE